MNSPGWPALALWLLGAAAEASTVSSSKIQVSGDDTSFIFGLGTAAGYSPSNASLTYSSPGPSITSHIVIWANGAAYDLMDTSTRTVINPMTAYGATPWGWMQAVYLLNAVPLEVMVVYQIVDNPQTNAVADTMMIKIRVRNMGGTTITYGVRLMYDTQINGNDGANISVNNGFSVVATNTMFTAAGGGMPGNWWGYDVAPPGTPNLVGRGSLWGNPYGDAATLPDALEIANWGETNGMAQWSTANPGTGIVDSAVVLWWTGTGSAAAPAILLNPGGIYSTFVAYYGINDGALLTTFTPTPVPGTPTLTPTFSVSPTPTPTPSITQTFSVTPTFSASPTVTPTPTITETSTITPTFSHSPSFSASPTFSVTRTITFTFTPTPPPLFLGLLPANPNPAATEAWLPYRLSVDAQVDLQVWTVAGEKLRSWDAGWRKAGDNEEHWDLKNQAGQNVSNGVYIYRIRAVSAANEIQQDFRKCAVAR